MTATPERTDLLATARAHAAAGGWEQLRHLLAERDDVALEQPELAALRAEAELRTGNPKRARAWLQNALPRVQRSGDRAALRRAVNYLGVADIEVGAIDEAARVFARALDLAQIDGDDLLLARATNNLGAIAHILGEREKALSLYQLAIPAYQRLGHTVGIAESCHNLAITCRHLGRLDQADEYEQRAIEYARSASNRPLLALALLGRAELALERGDAALAEAGARRAASDFETMPDPVREGDALRLLGAAALARGALDEARQALDRAVMLAAEHGNALNEAEARAVRARLSARLDDHAGARADVKAALAIYERLGAVVEREALERWSEGID